MPPASPAKTITGLETFLGYTFQDSTLAWEAMRREPVKGELNGRTQKESNKRLAILGDIVIYLVMGREWYSSNKGSGKLEPGGTSPAHEDG